MENFLSRLVMDTEGGVSQRKTMKEISVIRDNITSEDEERQRIGLMELCDMLNMSTSLTISSIRPNVFVLPLLNCLKREHNIDLMLLAARALTYMVDAIPATVFVLGTEGGIEVVLQHLCEVKDIELTEQCLLCVDKITQSPPGALMTLEKGGANALLAYVDFFSSSSQRKAWTSVAAMCRRVDPSTFSKIEASLCEIRARIDHDDGKIAEKTISSLYRIIIGVRSKPELVAEAFGDVCAPLMSILTRTDLTENTFSTALTLIGTAVSHSIEVTKRVLEGGLVECLFVLLNRSSEEQSGQNLRSAGASPMLQARSPLGPSFQNDSVSQGTLPSTGTRTTAAAAAAAAIPRDKRLTMEQTRTVCVALAGLLPRIVEGYLAYGSVLTELLSERSRSSKRQRFFRLIAVGGEEGHGDVDLEEEEEEEAMTLEEIRARILEEGPPIVKNPRYSNCRLTHICDGCRKSCLPGDWFRCNICSDFDYCALCLLMNWEEHGDSSTPHTFCDMREVLSPTNGTGSSGTGTGAAASAASGAVTDTATATVTTTTTTGTKKDDINNDTLNDMRQQLYKNNPHLLDIIASGLPKMVTLFNESETHIVRNHTLAFIDRAVFLASPQQLQNSGLDEASVCQMIVAAITDSSLILNVQAMPLCRKLLEKVPHVYKSAFVREGVRSALAKAQQQNLPKPSPGEESEKKKPLMERLHTVADWRELVVSEAMSLLALFPSANDASRVERLTEVVHLMQEGKLHEAFETLRLAILDDTTAYELASSNVLHELRETLSRVNDITVVVDLVKTLAKEIQNGLTALTRFVRHLQTVMSQLDQFCPPNLGDVNSIHVQIPVRLLPHPAETSRHKSTPANKGGVFQRLTATSTSGSREASFRRPTRVTSTRTGSITSTSAIHGNVTSSTTKDSAEAHEITVCIEPLTNMEALMSFVSTSIFGGNADESGSRRRQDDEDRIEEVLPELGKVDGVGNSNTKTRKAIKEKPIRSVYLRYGNHVLPPSMTILQVMQKYHNTESAAASSNRRNTHGGSRGLSGRLFAMREGIEHEGSWDVIKLYYSSSPFGSEYSSVSTDVSVPCGTPTDPIIVKKPSESVHPPAVLEVMHALNREYLFSDRFLTVAQKDVLTLLGTFYEVLKNWSALLPYVERYEEKEMNAEVFLPSTPLSDFIHRKLDNKAMRHSSNLLLAGQHLSLWAVNLALDCNFLFAPTTRRYLFEVSFCGTIRSLVQMQESMETHGPQIASGTDYQVTRVYTLQREKKRVWRDKALACAMQILGKDRIRGSSVLEFEYYNENGSGSGPTMEFYSLVSDELREMKLGLWRRTDETPDEKYYHPHGGLYPHPLPPNSTELDRIEPYFFLLGRLIARALLDKRILSIPLSPLLLKMLRGDECGVYDLMDISESLGAVIVAISLAAQKGSTKVQVPRSSKFCTIDDLGLDFTVPGDELIELKPGGVNIPVTFRNMLEYCDSVTLFLLQTGVERVVKALRRGFHDYIPLYALRMLSVGELHEAIHGHTPLVTVEELEANCSADHGYTITSRHVRLLFDIIASFNAEEQKRFFLFLTGSAHLPLGGLPSLRPKFTIVRKTSSDAKVREQDQLPSAMTCQNYLKLPAYDSKEQMEQKLRQAIDEGCGAFLLT